MLQNIRPGLHIVRFYTVNSQREYSWKNHYIWVWKTPARGDKEDVQIEELRKDKNLRERFRTMDGGRVVAARIHNLFPVRPSKDPIFGNNYRRYIEQQSKSSGNRNEQKNPSGEFARDPKKLGENEAF